MAAGQGYDAGAIFARLEIDKGKWNEAIQAVKNDQKELADAVAKGNVPLSQFGDLLKKYGVQTAQDARVKIAELRGDQVKLDTAFKDGIINLGGYQKATKDVQDSISRLAGSTENAEKGHKSLIGQIALGQLAYNLASKAASAFKDAIGDSVKEALGAEEAQSGLESALGSTGREVTANAAHFKNYGEVLKAATTFTGEEITSAQTLLVQLTQLNQYGIDSATKGAMGLATVFKMDLDSATRAVAQGFEGNYTALGKMIPAIRDAKTEEEKHAAMMEGLAQAYRRAEDQTTTTGGKLKQFAKEINDVKEKFGQAIIQSDAFQWSLGALPKMLGAAVDVVVFLANALDRIHNPFSGMTSDLKSFSDAAAGRAMALRDTFKYLPISLDDIRKKMEELNYGLDPEPFNKWARSMQAVDVDMGRHKNQILDIMSAAARWLGLTGEMSTKAKEGSTEIAALMREMAAAISKGWKDEYTAARDAAQLAYQDRLAAIKKIDAAESEKKTARIAAAQELAAVLHTIDKKQADDEAALTQEMGAAAYEKYLKDKALLEKRAKDEGDLYNDIAAAVKQYEAEQTKAYNARMAADELLYSKLDSLSKSGLARELADIKIAEAAEISKLTREAAAASANYSKEIAMAKAYYAELARLARLDQSKKIILAGWAAIDQMVSAVLSSMTQNYMATYSAMQKRSDDFFSAEQSKLDAEKTKKMSDLDAWYEAEQAKLDEADLTDKERKAAKEALDKEYATRKEKAEKEAADKQAKLDAEKAKKDLEIKRLAFEAQKRINVANAMMSTAAAIISAAQMVPFIPFGIIAMAAAAAAGAVQLAAIRSVPMPLAKGAAFKQETEFYTSGGGHYVAGEDGMEIMVGAREMQKIIRAELGGERNRGAKPVYHLHFDIGGKEVKKFIIDTGQELGFDANQWTVNRRNNA